ncbi:hypothetical protein RchiOBHm_Chr2g0132441 [Rosa chinensis]|uniref:Uncharacterized protein n=1 Tax=Rosa chinensis TaxID=74649 RepID=A0A2P6RVB7_ROSCH|nr:hypothetical protein RchiOBHm_Chr2g0132441 [Rosa chinensis]
MAIQPISEEKLISLLVLKCCSSLLASSMWAIQAYIYSVQIHISVLGKQYMIFANSSNNGTSEQPLGILSHQIRGSLGQFFEMTLVGHSSNSFA